MATQPTTSYGVIGLILTDTITEINSDWSSDFGVFYVDLSASGAVQMGRFDKPPMLPFVAFDLVGVDDDDDGIQMGEYEHTAEIFVEGWHTVPLGTIPGATLGGLNLAQTVTQALHNGHRDSDGFLKPRGVRRLNIGRHEFANTEINGRKVGHWRAVLEITYKTNRGI